MNHPTLQALTEAVHGLAPMPAHVADCDGCRALVGRLEKELRLLRLADERLSPPVRSSRLAWWPVAAAATVFLAIAALIIFTPVKPAGRFTPAQEGPSKDQNPPKEKTTEELIKAFMAGSDEAGETIKKRGPAALPALASARLELKTSGPNLERAQGKAHGWGRRYQQLTDLYYAAKSGRWKSEDAQAIAEKLQKSKVGASFEESGLGDAIAYLRDLTALNICIDPVLADRKVSFKVSDSPLRSALDVLTLQCDTDYDFRFGVLWIGTPDRLWSPSGTDPEPQPALTEAQAKAARAWIEDFGSDSPEKRDKATTEFRKLGMAALPFLKEGAKADDPETHTRCAALIKEIAGAALPFENAWARQDLKGDDAAIAGKLGSTKVTVSMADVPLTGLLELVGASNGLKTALDKGVEDAKVSINVNDLALSHVLELVTIPRGLDVKIESGIVVIFKRE